MFLDFPIYKELNSKITNNAMKTSDPIRKVEIYLKIAFYNNGFSTLNIRPTDMISILNATKYCNINVNYYNTENKTRHI
jgi:hypothetical protein